PTPSDSKSYRGCPPDFPRTPPATAHPPLPLRGWPLPAGTLSKPVAWECYKALPQTPAPPSNGWPVSSAGSSGRFAPPALPGFIAPTSPSAPSSRIGTLPLMDQPLGVLP